MQYLFITKTNHGDENQKLLPGDVLVKAVCNEFLVNRPIHRHSDLPRKGNDLFHDRPDEEDCRYQVVCKDEIVRIEAAVEVTVIHLSDKAQILSSADLPVFADALKDHVFCLVNPENLINLFYMERLDRPAAMVVLTNSEQIPVSADGAAELLRLFDRTDLI